MAACPRVKWGLVRPLIIQMGIQHSNGYGRKGREDTIMCRRFVLLLVPIGLSLTASTVRAQCCGSTQIAYAPVVQSYAANYTPTVTYYESVAPQVTYYSPSAVVDTTYYAPAPYVTYYAPATPQVEYYAQSATTYYAPVVQPYVTYYGTVGSSIYGTPKVYVPGQPVRNTLRAITP